MIAMTLAEIAEVVGGALADPADGGVAVTGPAFLDSRGPEPGGLFLAIAGEHVDGHDYAAAAHGDGQHTAPAGHGDHRPRRLQQHAFVRGL